MTGTLSKKKAEFNKNVNKARNSKKPKGYTGILVWQEKQWKIFAINKIREYTKKQQTEVSQEEWLIGSTPNFLFSFTFSNFFAWGVVVLNFLLFSNSVFALIAALVLPLEHPKDVISSVEKSDLIK